MEDLSLETRSEIEENLEITVQSSDGDVDYHYQVSAEWQNSQMLILAFTEL